MSRRRYPHWVYWKAGDRLRAANGQEATVVKVNALFVTLQPSRRRRLLPNSTVWVTWDDRPSRKSQLTPGAIDAAQLHKLD